jgi:N-acetylglucosamine-6-phosphate deacetylase
MRMLLTAAALVLPDCVLGEDPWLLIEDGVMAGFGRRGDGQPPHQQHYDLPATVLAPALVDIHVHGAMNHDVMEGCASAAVVSRFLATRGVGAFLPTTVTAPLDDTLRALDALATCVEEGATTETGGDRTPAARPLGVHLEGPFLSHAKRGVHAPQQLQTPSIALFDRFWQAARGTIRLMTIAPELPGALALIAHVRALGVRVSLGHSNATAAEAHAGIAAGAASATHTFNAMRGFDHREPGMLGAVLDAEDLYAEIIADGIHVDPIAIRLFAKAKRASRAILVTDGISATGMPNGRYRLGQMEVEVEDGRCTHDGVLAGSVLTLDRAVRNFADYTGLPLPAVTRMAAHHPAMLTGFDHQYGAICVGRRADLVALTAQGQLAATCIAGRFERAR